MDAGSTKHMREYARKRRYADKVAARRGYRDKARERKIRLVGYKGDKCMDCGKTYHFSVYHFDHRNPNEKLFRISTNHTRSWEVLIAEVDKCDLVCANCHAERTFANELVNEKMRAARLKSPRCGPRIKKSN